MTCTSASRRFFQVDSGSARGRKTAIGAVLAAIGLGVAVPASAQTKVVTTTATLADITRQIGGDHVEVESIMRGPEDVHNVSPKPSYVMSVKKAKLFIHSGLDAEAWAPLLVKSARNANLLPGAAGNLDASRGIALKEVPDRGQLTRALGDIHVFGNTHYTLDPLNGVIIARTIADALKQVDPAHAAEFDSSYEAFAAKLRATTERLTASLAPYRGTTVVTYHRSWPYFLDRFGLVSLGEIEPKPGISPGPRHLSQIADAMTARGAKVVIVETYSSRADAQAVADKVGGVAITLAQDVNAVPEVTSYEALFEYNVNAILEAFRRAGVPASKPQADAPAVNAGS